jgi:hypothetical protein
MSNGDVASGMPLQNFEFFIVKYKYRSALIWLSKELHVVVDGIPSSSWNIDDMGNL